MKTKDVRGLVREIIVDLDNALAGDTRPEEERHSAAASALILAARLLGGVAINQARIAFALERIADSMEDRDNDPRERSTAPGIDGEQPGRNEI